MRQHNEWVEDYQKRVKARDALRKVNHAKDYERMNLEEPEIETGEAKVKTKTHVRKRRKK